MISKSYTVRFPLVVAAEIEERAKQNGGNPAGAIRRLVLEAINSDGVENRIIAAVKSELHEFRQELKKMVEVGNE